MTALGVSLLMIGAIVIAVETHVPSFGILGGPGLVMLVVGAVLTVSGLGGGAIAAALIALMLGIVGAAAVVISVRKGMAVRRRRIRTGGEGLIGHLGVVRSWDEHAGKVQVDGALWRAARSLNHDEEHLELKAGDAIVVERLNGLTLAVRPAEEWELVR